MNRRQNNPSDHNNRPARVNLVRQLWMVFSIAAVIATLFTAWTPLGLVPYTLGQNLSDWISSPGENPQTTLPIATERPRPHIGIVAGHWGYDTGAICSDGLTEVDVNLNIATRVKEILIGEGYDVDLLQEKDDRLPGYHGLTLVSIHADSCDFINNEATGFKVASSLASSIYDNKSNRLVACLTSRYLTITGLAYHAGSITVDMTSYHAFDEIHSDTTAAIIETGFLNLDRQILTQDSDQIAIGIAAGILCYIRNEDATLPTAP